MAKVNETYVLEIPVDDEHRHKQICLSSDTDVITAIQHHPLMEISRSSGHLLLLKLWQREEALSGRRIAVKETKMESAKRDVFQNCCFFLLFHGIFLTLLFTASVRDSDGVCKKWWVPSVLSATTSAALAAVVQARLMRFWKVWRQLQRERVDGRALTRCVQELRMKGASFDLSKEPLVGKRMKSSSVEIKWKPLTWCSHYVLTICLIAVAALLAPASKLILCIF